MILVDFFVTRIHIIDTDQDPEGQNDTDPDSDH